VLGPGCEGVHEVDLCSRLHTRKDASTPVRTLNGKEPIPAVVGDFVRLAPGPASRASIIR
jgi:hypothetical protein